MMEAITLGTPVKAQVTDEYLIVELQDGRVIQTPLDWYPVLRKATPEQRNNIELLPDGLHWPLLDEDLSVRGMLAGRQAVDKDLLVSEVAQFFDISDRTVYAAIKRGRLPARKVGGTLKIRYSDATLWRAETQRGRPPTSA